MSAFSRGCCLLAILLGTAPAAAQTAGPGGIPPGGVPLGSLPPGAWPPGARADFWNDPRYQEAVKRLAKVRRWQAAMDVRIDYQTTGADPQHPRYSFHKFLNGFVRATVKGTFTLQRDPRNAQDVSPWWDADGTSQMAVHFETHELDSSIGDALDVPVGTTTKGSRRIRVGSDDNPHNLGIQPDGKLFLHFSGDDMQVDVTGVDTYMESGKPVSRSFPNKAQIYLIIHDIPLPRDSLRLQGIKTTSIGGGPEAREAETRADVTAISTPASSGGIHPIWDLKNPPKAATVKYDLVPIVEDLKLNVVIDDYDAWIPEGNKDASRPGNMLRIRAELKTRADAPPEVKAYRIKFELADVSDEPGTAMNWPPRGGGTNLKDLRFDPDRNANLQIPDPLGLEAATPYGEHERAEAVLSCYDYGAFGTLKVSAEHPYGVIIGKLVYDNKEEILLPKRPSDDTKIADAWKRREGVAELADDTDHDEKPRGDGYFGDGLTLYQEYRGFFEKGEHFRSDPKTKDLFVKDEIGDGRTRRGIQLFQEVTQLKVHYQLEQDELGADRVINANHKTAHVENQHGLRVTRTADAADAARLLGSRFRGVSLGGPGTPGDVERVVTDRERIPGVLSSGAARGNYAAHLAHELLHSVNVYHHGDDDPKDVYWKAVPRPGPGGTIVYQFYERSVDAAGTATGTARPVTVYDEGTTTPTAGHAFQTPRRVYLAVRNTASDAGEGYSQHSGVEECYMRYRSADAAAFGRTAPPMRYWFNDVREAERTLLCESTLGTGVNAPTRNGGPRYGDAEPDRGACKMQIRVNDYGDAPRR